MSAGWSMSPGYPPVFYYAEKRLSGVTSAQLTIDFNNGGIRLWLEGNGKVDDRSINGVPIADVISWQWYKRNGGEFSMLIYPPSMTTDLEEDYL